MRAQNLHLTCQRISSWVLWYITHKCPSLFSKLTAILQSWTKINVKHMYNVINCIQRLVICWKTFYCRCSVAIYVFSYHIRCQRATAHMTRHVQLSTAISYLLHSTNGANILRLLPEMLTLFVHFQLQGKRKMKSGHGCQIRQFVSYRQRWFIASGCTFIWTHTKWN